MNSDNSLGILSGLQPVQNNEANNVVNNEATPSNVADGVSPVVQDSGVSNNNNLGVGEVITPTAVPDVGIVTNESNSDNVTAGSPAVNVENSVAQVSDTIPVSPSIVVPNVGDAANGIANQPAEQSINFDLPSNNEGVNNQNVNVNMGDINNTSPVNDTVIVPSVDNATTNDVIGNANVTTDSNMNQGITPTLGFDLPTNEVTSANNIPSTPVVEPQTVITPTNDVVSNNNTVQSSNDGVVSVGKYLGHMFLFVIPVIGPIMLIVKAFDKKDKGISNFAKAQLLFALIITGISLILTFLIFVIFGFSLSAVNVTSSDNDTPNYSSTTDYNNYNYDDASYGDSDYNQSAYES